MKLSPKIYAKTLIKSSEENDLKKIAKNFWFKLQKNKQYKDLSKILDSIDEENAKDEDKLLAKVFSKNELEISEKETIIKNLEKKFGKSIILKNIVGKNITGIIVKIDDKIIDISLENKVKSLNKILNY